MCADGLLLSYAGHPMVAPQSLPLCLRRGGVDDIFQISHCHLATPGPRDEVLTKDGDRIWLKNIRIMDATGSFAAVVREKAALAQSELGSREAFAEACAADNISFPVLASARVLLARQNHGNDSPTQGGRCCRACLVERRAGGSGGSEYWHDDDGRVD